MMRFLVTDRRTGARRGAVSVAGPRSRCQRPGIKQTTNARGREDQRAHAGNDQRRQRERVRRHAAAARRPAKRVESRPTRARRGVRATAAGAATATRAAMDTAGKVVLRREVFALRAEWPSRPVRVAHDRRRAAPPDHRSRASAAILIDPTGRTRSPCCATLGPRSSTACASASSSAACASRASPRRR